MTAIPCHRWQLAAVATCTAVLQLDGDWTVFVCVRSIELPARRESGALSANQYS